MSGLSPNVREIVWDMTRGQCWYCGHRLNPFRDFEVEHMQPLSRGGTDQLENLVPSCHWCNQDKGQRTVEEFRPLFAESYGLGPDPKAWKFWHEHQHTEGEYPQSWYHLKFSRREWRTLVAMRAESP